MVVLGAPRVCVPFGGIPFCLYFCNLDGENPKKSIDKEELFNILCVHFDAVIDFLVTQVVFSYWLKLTQTEEWTDLHFSEQQKLKL